MLSDWFGGVLIPCISVGIFLLPSLRERKPDVKTSGTDLKSSPELTKSYIIFTEFLFRHSSSQNMWVG